MSITDALSALRSAAEDDDAFILAATLNLYNENIRRREGRILYGPEDVRSLFDVMSILIKEKSQGTIEPSRPTKPSPVEMEQIVDVEKAIADEVKRLDRRG